MERRLTASPPTLLRIDPLNPECCNQVEQLTWEHWPGAWVESSAGETTGQYDTSKALDMPDAFASVGATAFDVTLLDTEGQKKGSIQPAA
jgi:hypothetical protein